MTIAFNRINLGNETEIPPVNPPVIPPVNPSVNGKRKNGDAGEIMEAIVNYCEKPKGILEIAEMLGYKDKKTVHKYLDPLIEKGRIVMTVPEKPNSRNQKYLTIRK